MKIPYVHDVVSHNPVAASIILPYIFELCNPKSIVDVGCGIGDWIYSAEKMGLTDLIGIDGSYVDRSMLRIAESQFVEKDLTQPFNLNRKFDLAICLEVAEHLPESSASGLVESITNHADVVLFSAAIPGQTGQNHINEQWPQYWQALFEKRGFMMLDIVRFTFWDNKDVHFWYRQNMFLVVKRGHPLCEGKDNIIHSVVHPELLQFYEKRLGKINNRYENLKKRDFIGKIASLVRGK
jgi:hypothetical protein